MTQARPGLFRRLAAKIPVGVLLFVARRLVLMVPTLLGASMLIFGLMRMSGGDPAKILGGERASAEQLAKIRERWALDEPLLVQYGHWLGNALTGDLGNSIQTQRPVMDEFREFFPNTLELTCFAILLAVVLGGLAGVLSARFPNTVLDYGSMGGALVGISVPVFWLGLMLMFFFGYWLNILPVSGRFDDLYYDRPTRVTGLYLLDSLLEGNGAAFWVSFQHLLLPSIALSTIPMALIARMTRSSMLEVLGQDYIRTARAKGVPERVVVFRHALKNAMIPIVTVVGLQFGLLLSGAILTETVFSWPGIGRWAVNSVNARDYPAIQGCVLITVSLLLFVNLAVDVLYTVVDPRVRLSGKKD